MTASDPTDPADRPSRSPETRIIHSGWDPREHHGFVNPPVVHASTVLYETAEAHLDARQRYTYGRNATPTIEALEAAMTELEGAAGTKLAPSGLGAVALALLSAVSSGDHLLVTDSAYGPTRRLCDVTLKRLGIETTYYDPAAGAGIDALVQPNTRAILLESPGTATFEVQDVPAIVAVAKARGLVTVMDNTWATPLFFQPIAHGVDLSVQAATKYISGHSDVLIGTVAAGPAAWRGLFETHRDLGLHVGPDDIYLAWRGLKTMAVRLDRHQANGLAVAEWLAGRPEVARVLHPGLPSDPGHALWKRDFGGACGLFGVELKPIPEAALVAFLDTLDLFGMGYSWGGFESLVIKAKLDGMRSVTPWTGGPLIRLHVGLEDPADLVADLEAGFAALARAMGR